MQQTFVVQRSMLIHTQGAYNAKYLSFSKGRADKFRTLCASHPCLGVQLLFSISFPVRDNPVRSGVLHLGTVMIAASKNTVRNWEVHSQLLWHFMQLPFIFEVLLPSRDFTWQLFLNTVLEKSSVSYLSGPFPFCSCMALLIQQQQTDVDIAVQYIAFTYLFKPRIQMPLTKRQQKWSTGDWFWNYVSGLTKTSLNKGPFQQGWVAALLVSGSKAFKRARSAAAPERSI